jgi:DNA replicative helicase MCM subunit Mcm2 (Cdc46/Mcm family)
MMRRGKGGENEVVSNPQISPRSKKVLKKSYWAMRRRRRKASDEDRRTQMSLTVRLAEL